MPNEKQHLTFISYSKTNRGFALELAKQLKASGFLVWLDQLDIPTGARWDDEVEKALTECEIFMVILTSQSIASHNVKDEIGYAIDSNKRILPILLDQVNVPFRLRRFQYVDFTNKSNEEGIEAAKQLLRKLIDSPREPEAVPQPTSAPAQRPEGVLPSVPKSDPNLLAQRRVEAIRKAREKEQQERSKQSAPSTPEFERRPSQAQSLSRSKLLTMIVGATLVAILCLGGGWAVWSCCISPPPTETTLPPIPTTAVPTTVTPSFTPIAAATTEVVPTTPVPQRPDPVQTIKDYWKYVSNKDYEAAWKILTLSFKERLHDNNFNDYKAGYEAKNYCRIETSDEKLVQNEGNTAVVSVQVTYYTGANCSIASPNSFEITLIYNEASQVWQYERTVLK